jgi:hypothetical protein
MFLNKKAIILQDLEKKEQIDRQVRECIFQVCEKYHLGYIEHFELYGSNDCERFSGILRLYNDHLHDDPCEYLSLDFKGGPLRCEPVSDFEASFDFVFGPIILNVLNLSACVPKSD